MSKNKVEDMNIEDEASVTEETAAAASLKGGSHPDDNPKSKLETMKAVIGTMAAMSSDELTKWYNETIGQIGKEAEKIPSGAAGSNKATINTKPSAAVSGSVKEDLDTLFSSDDTLTEEAKDRMSTLFEAAVSARAMIIAEELEEKYATELEESANEIRSELEEKLDAYLDYSVNEWMEENRVAIESALRAELAEEFMEGLRGLFTEHFINIPAEKVDIVEELAAKVAELEGALDHMIEENAELREMETVLEFQAAFEEVSEGLTVSQTEKFRSLIEGLDFDGDVEKFATKLSMVRETYFPGVQGQAEEMIEEDTDAGVQVTYSDADVKRYAQALSRSIKK